MSSTTKDLINSKANLVGGKVPLTELGGSGGSSSTYLRGDQTWGTPTGGGALVETHIPMINLAVAQTI